MNRWQWALAVFLSVSPAHAQTANASDRGVITGSALDSDRLPIPGAKVYLQSSGKKEILTAQTNSTGVYRFDVPRGTYTVRAESDGKGEASAGPFAAVPRRVTTVDLVLQPSAAAQPKFFDEPRFTVAGLTDNTYRGGHGSDGVLRSAEVLAKETASLGKALPNANTSEPHHVLAEIDESSGHPLAAVQEFQRAAELNPSEPNLFDWGTELLIHRAPAPAAEVLTKGVRLFPQSLRMRLGLATAWYASGSYEQAAQRFFEAADLDPTNPSPYLLLSKVQSREITQSAGYEERLARFARLQPDNALANYYYAVSIWNRRSGPEDFETFRRARSLLERAVELDPHLGLACLQLGVIYGAERKYPDAIRAYTNAISAAPELDEAHYRLSEAYRLSGDPINAERELAVYKHQSEKSAEQVERERKEIQQFVVDLRGQSPAALNK